MSADINLLLYKEDELLKRRKRAQILNVIAVIVLTLIGIISLIIFLRIKAIDINSIKKEQDEILRKISKQQTKQAKLFVLNDKLNSIQEIFAKRQETIAKKQNLTKITSGLLTAIPVSLAVGNLEMDDKIIVLAGSSTSLFTIGELINNLTNMVYKKEIISSLTLTGLIFKETENIYQVSVKAEL